MKKINSIIYGLFGAGAIVYGATALLLPAVLESGAAQSFRCGLESGKRHLLDNGF
jgi:hypothetical protein